MGLDDDTTPFSYDADGRLARRELARYCRHAAVLWIGSKAAETSFQPTEARELVGAVCRHLVDAVPQARLPRVVQGKINIQCLEHLFRES